MVHSTTFLSEAYSLYIQEFRTAQLCILRPTKNVRGDVGP